MMGLPVPARGVQWKGILFINVKADRPEGWTETYHLVGDSYGVALGNLDAIWEARRATLCPDCILEYGIVSDEGIKGDSLVYFPLAGHLLGTYPGSTVHTLAAWNVVLCRFEAGSLYRLMRPVRGIPSDQDLSTLAPAAGGYLTALNAYMTAVKVNALARVKGKPLDPLAFLEYRPFTNAFALRWTERRDGRPFGLRRGRSRRLAGS
jgi:hypothetical protein